MMTTPTATATGSLPAGGCAPLSRRRRGRAATRWIHRSPRLPLAGPTPEILQATPNILDRDGGQAPYASLLLLLIALPIDREFTWRSDENETAPAGAATTRSLAAVLNSDSVIESSWREPVDMLVSQAGQERIDREVRLLLASSAPSSIDHVVPGAIIQSGAAHRGQLID